MNSKKARQFLSIINCYGLKFFNLFSSWSISISYFHSNTCIFVPQSCWTTIFFVTHVAAHISVKIAKRNIIIDKSIFSNVYVTFTHNGSVIFHIQQCNINVYTNRFILKLQVIQKLHALWTIHWLRVTVSTCAITNAFVRYKCDWVENLKLRFVRNTRKQVKFILKLRTEGNFNCKIKNI